MSKLVKNYKLIIFLAIVFVLITPCFIFAAEEYSDGALIRAEDDYKIYLVFNGKKRWLKNIDVFNSYGFKWQDIKVVNSAAARKMPLNNLVRIEGDIKVYVLNDFGYKRHIINPSIFNSYGFKWDDVAIVSVKEIDSYPESHLVRETGNPKVYFLEDNKKRWIDSIESFYVHNFNWEAIHIIDKNDIDIYQLGEVIVPASPIKKPSEETPAAVSTQPASSAATTTEAVIPIASTTASTATTTQPVVPAIPAAPAIPTSSSATTTQPAIPAAPAEPNVSTSDSSSANKPGTKKWEFAIVGSYGDSGTSAVSSDGTIYFGTGYGNLFALNSNGNEKWRLSLGINRVSIPAIGADGTIYVGSFDNKFYAINPNGTLKWSFSANSAIYSAPAIGSDGTIYFGSYDKKLYALNPNGTLKWSFTTGDIVYSSPAIANNGVIYFGSLDNKVYALNSNGTQKWSFTTGADVYSSPSIGSDGTIYIGSEDKKLYALNPNGTQKWSFTTGGTVDSSPAIGPDGTIYVGSYDKKLYALNSNGSQKWVFNASSPTGGSDGILSSPAVDSDGVIYFGNRDYGIALQAVNPDGTLKWSFSAGSWITNSPSIGPDGTVYIGADDYKFYAINTASSGLSDSPWPKFHKDNRNTGRFSGGGSITPADVNPPVISNIQVSDITETSAVITWTTDESANSKISYSHIFDVAVLTATTTFIDFSMTTSHSVNLSQLSHSTTYYYLVVSVDGYGNTATSSTQSFVTLSPPAPSIQWKNIRVTDYSEERCFPDMAADGSGYGIVWADYRNKGEAEVYFAKLDEEGTKIVNDTKISNNPSKLSYYPAIVWTGSEYGIVWSEYSRYDSENNNGCYLYFAKVSSSGIKQGDNILVTSDNYGICPSNPSIAWSGSEYGISWDENRAGTEISRIFFARLNSNGVKQGEDVQISASIASGSSIIWNGSEYGVVWPMRFVRVSADGKKQGSEVSFGEGDAYGNPSLIWNGSNYGVAWSAYSGGTRQIFFTKLDQNGSQQGSSIMLTSNSGSNYSVVPDIAVGSSGYGITWHQSGDTIYFVNIDSNGSKRSNESKISDAASGQAMHSKIAWNGSISRYAIAWQDSRENGTEIYFAVSSDSVVYASDKIKNPQLASILGIKSVISIIAVLFIGILGGVVLKRTKL